CSTASVPRAESALHDTRPRLTREKMGPRVRHCQLICMGAIPEQGRGSLNSLFLRRPGPETCSPARPDIVFVALADRRARKIDVDTDGNVGRQAQRQRGTVERARRLAPLVTSSPDSEEHLIEMPFVAVPRTSVTQLISMLLAQLATPLADSFVCHDDSALQQKFFSLQRFTYSLIFHSWASRCMLSRKGESLR